MWGARTIEGRWPALFAVRRRARDLSEPRRAPKENDPDGRTDRPRAPKEGSCNLSARSGAAAQGSQEPRRSRPVGEPSPLARRQAAGRSGLREHASRARTRPIHSKAATSVQCPRRDVTGSTKRGLAVHPLPDGRAGLASRLTLRRRVAAVRRVLWLDAGDGCVRGDLLRFRLLREQRLFPALFHAASLPRSLCGRLRGRRVREA